MGLRLVTAPATYPVTLQEAKDHLRILHDDNDDLLTLLIAAETRYAEVFTGRKFVPQTWDYFLDAFPGETQPQIIRLPIPKVISVDAVYYQDANGDEQTLDTALYVADVDSQIARIGLAESANWPQTYAGLNAIRVRLTVGDQDSTVSPATTDVREDVKLAILLRVQASFDGADAAEKYRETSEIYLKKHRVVLSLG